MKKDQFVAIEDAASRLGICDEDLISWIERDGLERTTDHRDRSTIPLEIVKKYATSINYDNAIRKAILLEKGARKRLQRAHDQRRDAIDQIVEYLRPNIHRLEIIHQYYLDLVNERGYESNEMAAYLLFSRVIGTLKMCCVCATNRYWFWGSLLREIDEALDVALYFVISNDMEAGRAAVRNWFRLNEAPRHATCRKEISKHQASVNSSYTESDNKELMDELYNKKSKFTHPTFGVIREIAEFEVSSNEVTLKNIDCGPCLDQHPVLELVDFFKSSVLTACQYFLQCFWRLPLLREHWSELREIERVLISTNMNEAGN